MNIEKGLVIAEPWVSKILSGEKIWEMRSRSTSMRGPIALIKKGSGTIVGVVSVTQVSGPYGDREMSEHFYKHHVPDALVEKPDYKWRYAWHLESVVKLDAPVPYRHSTGAVTWVNLSGDTQKVLAEKLLRNSQSEVIQ